MFSYDIKLQCVTNVDAVFECLKHMSVFPLSCFSFYIWCSLFFSSFFFSLQTKLKSFLEKVIIPEPMVRSLVDGGVNEAYMEYMLALDTKIAYIDSTGMFCHVMSCTASCPIV